MGRGTRRAIAVLALLALAGCYAPSAARRAARIARSGWEGEVRGARVLWTGPAMTGLAMLDFAVHALVPLHYDGYFLVDRREPSEKWFRSYPGPMRPLEQVAILCNADRATSIHSIRPEGADEALPARHQPWHYPRCIEVPAGRYELVVHYYARTTRAEPQQQATTTTESTRPSVAQWSAEAGAIYQLQAILGRPREAPVEVPNFFRARPGPRSPGTTTYKLEVATWNVRIDRLASPRSLEAPVLEHRERWRRYEQVSR